MRAFKARLEDVQAKLRKEGFDFETVKALAEVAVHRSKEADDDLPLQAVATFSLDEIEADQAPHAAAGDLLDLSSPPENQATRAGQGSKEAVWDPFSDLASQNGATAATNHSLVPASNPFAVPASASGQPAAGSLVDFDLAPPVGACPLISTLVAVTVGRISRPAFDDTLYTMLQSRVDHYVFVG